MGLIEFSRRTMVYWNKWEIRGMILLSLFLQIFLIIFGKQRQYVARKLVGNLVWLAYLSADWVANFILGLMSSEQGDCAGPRNALLAFWAPFLLVHLGGIDTISAFSLEDNELWTRHLLQLLGHIVGVIYVFFRSWTSDDLIFVAFLIFFTGMIKYGERTMALRHASTEQLRESLNLNGLTNAPNSDGPLSTRNDEWPADYDGCIHEAYALFEILLMIYSGTILRLPLHKRTYEILQKKSATQAFKIIEVELGFLYDWLYTKVPVVYTPIGASFRFSCCLCYISALFVFLNIIHKQNYSLTDNAISYTLLIGSLVLEIYAILVLVFSDWAMLWFSKQRKPLTDCFYHGFYTSCLRSLFINKKRWSGSMAQFNFISFCSLKVTNWMKFKAGEILGFHERREKVNAGLKELIFGQLLKNRRRCNGNNDHLNVVKQLLAHRGEYVLEMSSCVKKIGWSVIQLDFHHSVLCWHLATDICYHDDCRKHRGDANRLNSYCKMSKALSEYMGYLLFRHPSMLPKGVGELKCRETMKDIERFVASSSNRREAAYYIELLEARDETVKRRENPENNLSVLSDGCSLARSLQSLETEELWTNRRKWEMISEVWVEMLTHASSQCGWKEHAKQLSQGGELLTHVAVIMAHLGLHEQCWDDQPVFSANIF